MTELYVPDEIAVLAPGQEWRTVWDSARRREDLRNKSNGADALESRFKGFVTFEDRDGRRDCNPVLLDWDSVYNTMELKKDKPEETIAEPLEAIAQTLKSFQDEHGGIWTYIVPGEQ